MNSGSRSNGARAFQAVFSEPAPLNKHVSVSHGFVLHYGSMKPQQVGAAVVGEVVPEKKSWTSIRSGDDPEGCSSGSDGEGVSRNAMSPRSRIPAVDSTWNVAGCLQNGVVDAKSRYLPSSSAARSNPDLAQLIVTAETILAALTSKRSAECGDMRDTTPEYESAYMRLRYRRPGTGK